jgi:hypothetical protein
VAGEDDKKHWGFKNGGDFLTSCLPISSSRTLFHGVSEDSIPIPLEVGDDIKIVGKYVVKM